MASNSKKANQWIIILSAVLLGLLLIIGSLIYSDRKKAALTQAPTESIETLRIQRPDFADTRLSLVDDQWTIEKPCQLGVNMQRLEPLLGALEPASHSYAAADVDLDAAGLTEPAATVFLNDSRIDIGNVDLNGDRRYIKRDGRVEFAPEWILSLINGGLSAMARLEIFDTTISAIQVVDDSGTTFDIPAESITDWQALTAQQILSWPLQAEEEALIVQTLDITQANTDADANTQLEIHTYSAFTALHYEGEQCAYILDTESLPDTTPP